jgi:hypothetical protein
MLVELRSPNAWFLLALVASGCSSNPSPSGFDGNDGADASPDTAVGGKPSPPGATRDTDAGSIGGNADGGANHGDAGTVVVSTTIYGTTDDTLYSLDPKTSIVTMIGAFAGTTGKSGDKSITDVAVNAAGDVYANSETVIYRATLPTGGAGAVSLTKVGAIATAQGQLFYALGFTPVDALGAGSGEVLVGGDGNGELWSIDLANGGALRDLGNFGNDPSHPSSVLALSGDVVFYLDAANAPTGLATVRSCSSTGSATCITGNDYLVAIDMAALKGAYASGTRAKSLNGGIYGGSSTSTGQGVGHAEVYGLGAWNSTVFGFARGSSSTPATLLAIATPSGVGTTVATNAFSNGWSGAGVSTKVTVSIPPPPPPPN